MNRLLSRLIAIIAVGIAASTAFAAEFISASPNNNAYLRSGEVLVAPGKQYFVAMQRDGNLVMYRGSGPADNRGAVWQSNTAMQPEADYFLAMQGDGNLVIYRGTPESNKGVVWHAQTHGTPQNHFLVMQDDANLVIYRGSGPADNKGAVWSIKTGRLGAGFTDTPKQCSKWSCIGVVQRCCDDGRVEGVCVGLSGC